MAIYTATDIANAFIQRGLDGQIKDLTPMKLQKLMFFAQSWYLKINGQPLFNAEFERWEYGPVIPEIYFLFKQYRSSSIDACAKGSTQPISADVKAFFDKLLEVYGKYTGSQLSTMTHQKDTAWAMGAKRTVMTEQELIAGKV